MPASELLEIDQWILLRAEELVARCRAWYDEFAFHKVYHAVYDFATVDLSAVYFDVLEGPAVHRGAGIARAAQRADRALSDQLRAGAPARAAAGIHRRRGVGVHAKAGRRRRTVSISRYSPSRAKSLPVSLTTARARQQEWMQLMEVRDEVLNALETGSAEERDRCSGSKRG